MQSLQSDLPRVGQRLLYQILKEAKQEADTSEFPLCELPWDHPAI